LLGLALLAGTGEGAYSELWGKDGEAWTAAGRLPDFSFAGYGRGEKEIPVYKVGANVRDLADNSLAAHLYSADPGPMKNIKGRTKTSLVRCIMGIAGRTVTFDWPLRCDVELRWKPELCTFEPKA
jgi:hypothetical protein